MIILPFDFEEATLETPGGKGMNLARLKSVGVHRTTTRLRDGQRVTVDGTTGQVVVLE